MRRGVRKSENLGGRFSGNFPASDQPRWRRRRRAPAGRGGWPGRVGTCRGSAHSNTRAAVPPGLTRRRTSFETRRLHSDVTRCPVADTSGRAATAASSSATSRSPARRLGREEVGQARERRGQVCAVREGEQELRGLLQGPEDRPRGRVGRLHRQPEDPPPHPSASTEGAPPNHGPSIPRLDPQAATSPDAHRASPATLDPFADRRHPLTLHPTDPILPSAAVSSPSTSATRSRTSSSPR